jgi:type II secretory pathway pseudopilin PulG
MTTRARTDRRRAACGYTLFEILLALGVIAILMGLTVPAVMNSFSPEPSEEAVRAIEKTALSAHESALNSGEARRVFITDKGLKGTAGVASAELPEEWKLQVRRFTENRFRKPERGEFWEFNGAGICEPLALRLVSENDKIVLQFDPLTAMTVPLNE